VKPRSLVLPLLLAGGVVLASQVETWKAKLFGAVPPEVRAQVEQIAGKDLFQHTEGAAADLQAQADAIVGAAAPARAPGDFALTQLRRATKTTIGSEQRWATPPEAPPAGELELVRYRAPLGDNVAYVTPVKGTTRGPAIVWLVGGFGFGIGSTFWHDAPRSNDQSARQLRRAGIVTMYPSLRGANGNPGHQECFLGEVDDILAAVEYLASRADVDPARIYLGGHSTGGTLALLVAASSASFRAIFAFGPVADARQYGPNGCLPAGVSEAEWKPRSAATFLSDVVTPTFIIEGTEQGNALFDLFRQYRRRAPIDLIEVPGANHFSVLAPGVEVVAAAILADTGEKPAPSVSAEAIVERLQAE
jgi:dipeptidyl aminopeptidase/acylaminoacyl peptidase